MIRYADSALEDQRSTRVSGRNTQMKHTPTIGDKSPISGRVPEETEDAFEALEATNIQKITIET